MRKFGILILTIFLVSLAAMAQPGQRNMNPEEMAKRQTAQLKEAVGLDNEQEKKAHEIYLETGKRMSAMREEMQGGGFEGMREKMQEMRAEQDKKLKEVLTEAQWKKYEKFQEERRTRMGQGQGRPGGRR
jgi:periplasmic protein CpxP/Spy